MSLVSLNGKSLGAIRSPYSEKDYKVEDYLPTKFVLPPMFTYRNKLTSVKNQMHQPECVAFASIAVLEYVHLDNCSYVPDLSEAWLYTKCKAADGDPNGEGTNLRTACDIMVNTGVCQESYWPWQDKYPMPTKPDTGSDDDAAKFKLGTYALAGIDQLKSSLFHFSPLAIAIAIYENFDVDKNNFMVPAEGQEVGGHALCLASYLDIAPPKVKSCCMFGKKGIIKETDGFYEIKNSWGEDWADKGYFKIHYKDMPKVFWEGRSVVDDN
jgi:C1A family cysteine protease